MSQQIFRSKHNSSVAITVESLSKQFYSNGATLSVLKDLSFNVKTGEILAILGKSGSGKSTLLNIIGNLEEPTEGSVTVHGSIGYVPQKDLLLPWRTVIENIVLPIEINQGNLAKAVKRARSLLAKNGLAQFEKSYPSEISGGMRQKVSLIRTLVQESEIILFDEPFSAIDFDARLQLVKDVRAAIISAQKTAIFVTHNIEEAIAVADTLVVLSHHPASIIHQTNIDIPEEYRDPINVRKSEDFQQLFEQIWKLMSK